VNRILHILDHLDSHGAAGQLGLLATGLPPGAFAHHACGLSAGGPPTAVLERSGVAVRVLGRRWPLDPQTWWRLRGEAVLWRPDLIHAWGPAAAVYGLAAAKACGVGRFILQGDFAPAATALERAAERGIAWCADAVVVGGPAARDAAIARGLSAARIRVIPAGVAPPPLPVYTRGQWLRQLGLDESCRLVGVFGPLREAERLKDAIWAADLLKVIRPDVHLLLYGDGPHRDRLLQFREQVLIRDKVHFLGQARDACEALAHLDVFWSAGGTGESAGAILAAMAAGIPVVAADTPGTRELIVPGVTGYLFRVGHRAGLAGCTQHLLESPEAARRLADAARRRALQDFSAEKLVRGYAALYGELLNTVPPPAGTRAR
jgi:glycosyltransferase involved in cell wall biosynthesis